MVKRTVVVLSILALTLTAGMAFGFGFGGSSDKGCETRPLFVPAPCPDVVPQRMVKTWECKIVAPLGCPPPCGPGAYGKIKYPWDKAGLCKLCMTLGALAMPFDWLVGGSGAVYGCTGKTSFGGLEAGPIPAIVGYAPTTFGSYW